MGYAMDPMDSNAFEQTILKLGLVNQGQLAEVHDEIGPAPAFHELIAALERKGYLTPLQRGKVLKGDTDGYILGGYKLLYKIQSGSFGRVYRAVDPRDGRVVAVKVLRRRWSENEQRIEMFIREGKVGLMLKHPNIVEVLAINRDPSSLQYYIVMEFVEGGNLREILQIQPGKKMTVAQSLRIIEDCANGLTYAYSRGMTHRDIKLTNILISDTGEAKLVDFGLAQFFSAFARTEEEKVDRTVDYAGLERGTEVKMGDVRSDLYFLGCVLYECLTGRPPLSMTRDKNARMRKARFEEVRPIHPNEIDGPPSVLMLVETMMALDPKQRYQTPSQMLDAIRRVRREVESNSGNGDDRPIQRSVFLAEPDERLQGVLRDGLKDQGYRVYLAGDPLRALDRFHKQPFDGLIVDARTTGEEGLRVFENVIDEAARRRLRCAAMLLIDEEQSDRVVQLPQGPHIGFMSENITFKTVSRRLKELMAAAHDSENLPALVRPAPPPPPPPRVLEPLRQEKIAPLPPRVAETPRREKIAPPPSRVAPTPRHEKTPPPRREPSKPSAYAPSSSQPPSSEEIVQPAFFGFSVMTDDLLPPSDLTDSTPLQSALMDEDSPLVPAEETTPATQSDLLDDDDESPLAPPEEAAPPLQSEPMTSSAPADAPQPLGDDLPMLALEGGMTLPPMEEFIPSAPRQEAEPPQQQEPAAPPRLEISPPPSPRQAPATPPPRRATVARPRRTEAVVPPPRQEPVAPPRVEPRRKKDLEPFMQHLTHEDPLAPPDTHHWKEELGVEEKPAERETLGGRLKSFWESLTPKQKSIAGLSLLGLVVALFLLYMVSDMLTQSKLDKIQEGMSLEEVQDILGGPGEKIELGPTRKGIGPQGPIKPETWRWEVHGRIIIVTFSNGKMIEGGKQVQEK